jgi:hypothetical protein
MPQTGQRPMEKHIQTILLSVITALLIGVGTVSINTYRQIGIMQFQIDDMSKKSDQYITRSEADSRAKMRDLQFSQLETRVSALEAVRKLP